MMRSAEKGAEPRCPSNSQTITDLNAPLDVIHRALAIVEYDRDGCILSANPKFLKLVGRTQSEVVGQSHCRFVNLQQANAPAFAPVWFHSGSVEPVSGEFQLIGKDKQVWIQATYQPVLDDHSMPIQIVQACLDITDQKRSKLAVEELIDEVSEFLSWVSSANMETSLKPDHTSQLFDMLNHLNGAIGIYNQVQASLRRSEEVIAIAAEAIASGHIDLTLDSEHQASAMSDYSASVSTDIGMTMAGVTEVDDQLNRSKTRAFQTTLTKLNRSVDLALDASLDVIRASSEGQPVEVIADKITGLAYSSAASANNIRTLIQDYEKETSAKLDNHTCSASMAVGERIETLSSIVSQISGTHQSQTRNITKAHNFSAPTAVEPPRQRQKRHLRLLKFD
jgi:methyl-accepting chemotaxis protein